MDHQRNIITPAARKFVFSRRLPKTGQVVIRQADDDGDYQAGWDIGQRFISKTLSGDEIVCDRATGLMWPRSHTGAGGNFTTPVTWAAAITYCEGLNFAGFTDWRLPNIMEGFTMYNHGQAGPGMFPRDWPPFVLDALRNWSSTTLTISATRAWVWQLQAGVKIIYEYTKTDTAKLLAVRRYL